MRGKGWWLMVFAVLGTAMALAGLATGSAQLPLSGVWRALFHAEGGAYEVIVLQVRLPEVITALTAGAGLAAAGLLMQTVFLNPLAGPGVLGLTGGASLGVALVMLAQPLWALMPLPQDLLETCAALSGAMAVLHFITMADRRVGDGVTLLIFGLMVGCLCGALVSVLQAGSEAGALKGFVLWGLGSFAGMELARLPWLVVPVAIGLLLALTMVKPLNAL